MKRIIAALSLVFFISVALTACNIDKKSEMPHINLNFNISNLTDEEFQSVGTKGLENAKKDDFKNIEFTLHVEYSSKISKGTITVPDIEKTLHDKGIFLFGQSDKQDNPSETFANYEKKYVLFCRGLYEQAIRNILNSLEVKVSWKTSWGENKERVFNLGEIIKFK